MAFVSTPLRVLASFSVLVATFWPSQGSAPSGEVGEVAGLSYAGKNDSNHSNDSNASNNSVPVDVGGGDNVTHSTNSTPTNDRLALCDLGPQDPVAIGDYMSLCVFLSTQPPKKMVFRVKVEEYTQLLLKGSQSFATASKVFPIYTWAAVSQEGSASPLDCGDHDDIELRRHLVSCPQAYATSSHLAHMLSLVLNLRDGVVSSFAWDNGCAGCGPNACVESSKAIDLQTGAESGGVLGEACGADLTGCSSSDVGCNMKVFVTWAGTDKDGKHASSAGMRMSKFTGFTLTSLYEKVNQNFEKVVG